MASQHPCLSALLAERGVILLDGAQGTELEQRGVNLGTSRLWSAQLLIDNPSLLRDVHLDYLRAGSDIITTFTYQASPQGFAEAGVDAPTAASLLNRAVDLAAEARAIFLAEQRGDQEQQEGDQQQEQQQGQQQECEQVRKEGQVPAASEAVEDTAPGPVSDAPPPPPPRRPLIAYSCGSYGGYLADGSEFRGDYAESTSLQDLMDFHRARLDPVRHRTEIDLLAFETIPCLKEAEAIVALLRQEQYGKPAWISFSCRDAVHTCHGERFGEECVPLLAAAAVEGLVAAAGVNCTAPHHVGPLLAAAREQLAAWTVPAAASGGGGGSAGSLAENAAPPLPRRRSTPAQQQRSEPACPLLLLCYPNSGEEWDGSHRCWRHSPDDLAAPSRFADAAAGWVHGPAGVRLVGGCCRTGPEHIRALRRAMMTMETGPQSQQQPAVAGAKGEEEPRVGMEPAGAECGAPA